jgi:hypothetical protein
MRATQRAVLMMGVRTYFFPFGEPYVYHTTAVIFLATTARFEFWSRLLWIFFSKYFKIRLRGVTYDMDVRPLQGLYS